MIRYRDFVDDIPTTLDPSNPQTMHAFLVARYVYRTWEVDLGAFSGNTSEHAANMAPYMAEAYAHPNPVSLPTIAYAATCPGYDPVRLVEIPPEATPLMVFAGVFIDGDKVDVDVLTNQTVADRCATASDSMARAMRARGMSVDHAEILALPTPLSWASAARLAMVEPLTFVVNAGTEIAGWLGQWAASTYIAARDGLDLPELEPAPTWRGFGE